MKKILSLLAVTLFTINASFAQIVGGEAFLQGTFLEIGVTSNGAFGTCTVAPPGYHAHCTCGPGGGINTLDEVYDFGHDGWGVGSPTTHMGGYTSPGSPFEGWVLEINGTVNEAYQNGTCPATYPACCYLGFYTAPTGSLTGSVSSYTNVGGRAIANWTGTAAGGNLDITQETRVDLNASWVVVTTKMINRGSTPLTNIYYERTCDPDNSSSWPSGTSQTKNTIVFQNDWNHRVLVSAYDTIRSIPWTVPPTISPYDSFSSYLGIGTKDCRAHCTFFMGGSLFPAGKPSDVWAGTAGAAGYAYNPGTVNNQDIGFALVYNIGTINPGDSAVISYAYIFNNDGGLDDAFPDPVCKIGPSIISLPVWPYNAKRDTFDACLYPTVDSIQLEIPFAEDKNWTWSEWKWSPATALSATTGTKIWANLRGIPGAITYTVIGTDSAKNMYSCNYKTFIFTIKSCHQAWATSDCYGFPMLLGMSGDSLNAKYSWVGPHGFTSTLHHPFFNPATYKDTGVYYVYKTIDGIIDTDSVRAVVFTKPTITASNNSPLCDNKRDTLELHALPGQPGMTYQWTGPNTFTSALQHPFVYDFKPVDVGTYTVVATTANGCKDTDVIYAGQIPPPPPPIISGDTVYCQNETFRGFTATTAPPGGPGTILWYTVATGGTSSSTPPAYVTTSPGTQTVYATVLSAAGCESARTPYSIRVKPTPAPPTITGGSLQYCQYIGPFAPVTVVTVAGATYQWYTVATGGTPQPTQPTVDLTMVGTFNSYVSQTDNGCEGPRTLVAVVVNPKPAPPTPLVQKYCQFDRAVAVSATPSIPGDKLRWYHGALDAVGTLTPFIPITTIPSLDSFFVDETSAFGCISEKALDTVRTNPKPAAPLTRDTIFCQWSINGALTADSAFGARLKWYDGDKPLAVAPVPHNTKVGDSTFYVTQVLLGCESDPAPIKVTTIYKPVFTIQASSPYVCQFDSVRFAYSGPKLFDPAYSWGIPKDARFAHGKSESDVSLPVDSAIYVRFDSVTQDNYVTLHVTNNDGFCAGDTSIRIKIVAQPTGRAITKSDVCQGDTMLLALGAKSASAEEFLWQVDNIALDKTTTLNILAHNNNSGGPFSISWNDVGRHVIQVTSRSKEGCRSLSSEDTVHVHVKPDATFTFELPKGTLCVEDSVLFTARNDDYRNSYFWTPEHYFSNDNKRSIYGKVEESKSYITLRVTDPFGCFATTSQLIEPGSCCTVSFPTAFTPNGDGKNDVFRPIFVGFHRFHEFRIVNRWGQTVFQSANSDMKWDGTLNQVPQDMGVYFYYIKYDCGGKTLEQNGDVTLIR